MVAKRRREKKPKGWKRPGEKKREALAAASEYPLDKGVIPPHDITGDIIPSGDIEAMREELRALNLGADRPRDFMVGLVRKHRHGRGGGDDELKFNCPKKIGAVRHKRGQRPFTAVPKGTPTKVETARSIIIHLLEDLDILDQINAGENDA